MAIGLPALGPLGFTLGQDFGEVMLPPKPTSSVRSPARSPAQTTQKATGQRQPVMQTVPNTTQQFMQPVQQMLNRMQSQDAMQRAANQQIAQNQQAQAAAQQAQMGMFLNRATGQMSNMFNTGLDTLRGLAQDPQMNRLVQMGFEQAQNPGLSRSAIAGMKGQAAASSAANLASQQRRLASSMFGRGVSGAAQEFMRQGLTNRAGSDLSRQMTGIDIEAEKFARQRQGAALGQLSGLIGQRQGASRQLAAAMFGYNPLSIMQQVQGIQAPQQQLGFNIGAL